MAHDLTLIPPKNPNPQGKGLVPVLQDWSTMETGELGPKSCADFLRDYCISSLILSADFRFKPVKGSTYFLYTTATGLSLSLIAPQEWRDYKPGEFLGSCHLRSDMTWKMEVAELEEQSKALTKARELVRSFMTSLKDQRSIRESLPFYAAELPYYQRMLSTALSSSLQRSLPPSGDDMKALLQEQPAPLGISAPNAVAASH